MKKYYPLVILSLHISLSMIVLCGSVSSAATPCDPWIAKMESVQGNVEFLRSGQTQWQPGRLNDTYCTGDRIQVGANSRADVYLANQSVIRLDQNTTITLGGVKEERTSLLQLLRGTLYFFSRLPRNLEILTAFVNAGVEGTEGLVSVQADRATILIFEGNVLAQNQFGNLSLTGGQSAVAEQGRPPALAVVVRPRDAVQWALYYPPTLHFRPDDFPPGPGWEGMVRSSIEAYQRGDLLAAFESIKGVPDTTNDARFFTYRAALLLAVGRVDDAAKDIERALGLRPAHGDALGLRAVIAVAQNEKEQALESAKAAVTTDPKSAPALIALSYAQQANFDLESARNALQQAVQSNPDNALAWARLAELHMSFAELDDALEAAKRAVALDPNLSRTQTVLGFAYLTQIKTTDAKRAFTAAIGLDQADPLPRLGLGLAIIRDGDLDEGRRQIDIAVSLDPDNSLMRSYLGKTYFEEKRDTQAARQYEMAKQLDPKDPTPYFYDAIRKQTTNRPVEALQDMEKAIELNDNRAVYRSRLALDSDLAARSASLGRIYNDLGFQELGLVEGWKSVNIDPSNYSAHRLLADNYAALPRHEIARVSELLQSQLLQPINLTPVQPVLAESNLLLVEGGGPSSASFNEFNPLFTRNRLALQLSGIFGSRYTFGDEITQSGVWNNLSYSLGQFHFQTDGFRKNNDLDVNIYNAFVQAEISPMFSVQAEVRHRDVDNGNLNSFFSPTANQLTDLRNVRERSDSETYRLGIRVSPSNRSDLLASFMYLDEEDNFRVLPAPTTSTTYDGYLAETQYLYRAEIFNAIVGGGSYRLNRAADTQGSVTRRRTEHENAYLYTRTQFPSIVTWTLGLSGDFFESDSFRKKTTRINPKVGMLWNIFGGTVFRAAWFRAFKRSSLFNQTLEPTQVAGFNQLFDDFTGTKSERWGVGVDHRFSPFVTGGVEISRRHLSTPVAGTEDIDRWKELFYRAYLQVTPHPRWALELQYSRERFDNLESVGPRDTDTHILPFTISYFSPSGFFARLRASYLKQSVDLDTEPDSESAPFLDLGLGYRLPRRLGIFEVQFQNILNQHYRYEGLVNRRPRERAGLPSSLPFPPEFTVFFRFNLAF